MGFPTSVQTFTTKLDGPGNTIQAEHVNTLQTEVAAIETGYLNGTARLNAGASTLASLSVVGGSTLASAQVTGESTWSGNVTLGANLQASTQMYTWPTVRASSGQVLTVESTSGSTAVLKWVTPLARAVVLLTHDVLAEIASQNFTGLNWNTETADASAMHSTSVNSSRITFAASTGLYLVGASFAWGVSTNARDVRIVLNDTLPGVAGGSAHHPNGGAGEEPPSNVTAMIRVADLTDYVTVQAFADGSTGRVLVASTSVGNPRFWAQLVNP